MGDETPVVNPQVTDAVVPNIDKPFYKQKKFWATVVTGLIATATAYLGSKTNMDIKTIILLLIAELGPSLSYIFGQAVVDAKVYSAIAAQPALLAMMKRPKK